MSARKKPAVLVTVWTVAVEVWHQNYAPTLVSAQARKLRSGVRLTERSSAWGWRANVPASEAHLSPEAAIDAWRADVERRIADARAEVRRLERLATEPVREPASTPACDAPVSRIESVAEPNRWLSIAERIADQSSGWKP